MKKLNLTLAALALGAMVTGCAVDDEERDAGDQSDVSDPGGDDDVPEVDEDENGEDDDEED
ncbi:hypothetical protein CR205_18540 [Alteribacter lacisalsi]|uniref:DNA primase n=1 Tax=Alteribacter lacisalsi TaxID=2045244 RepID=A0A2W0HFE6_9BACI|nr:hypothetical protein [Alteribacter lacisalsi]PYZ95529.1 hypothetical protein CR205_18540 [Alteribacter lacisalsi]